VREREREERGKKEGGGGMALPVAAQVKSWLDPNHSTCIGEKRNKKREKEKGETQAASDKRTLAPFSGFVLGRDKPQSREGKEKKEKGKGGGGVGR